MASAAESRLESPDERATRDETIEPDELIALRKRMGYLFQDGALINWLSVGENVALPLRENTDLSDAEIREKVEHSLALVQMVNSYDLRPPELSGGMRKRAAFARAIALRPDIVLCDEPSSGLDPVMSATLDDLILELHRTLGMTFIVISHDTAEARAIATHIGLLYQGKLQVFGEAHTVLQSSHAHVRQFFERNTQGPIKVL